MLGEDTTCSTEPQSLIAEYFIDCQPKGPPIAAKTGDDQERAENPDIPVSHTTQTVQNDLVLSALRLPFRDRLTLLINEFGTALAGNADNLNDAIRRGAPALEQTQQVLDLLASQNTMIRDLNVNSDRIIAKLAERREDVVNFIKEANQTAQASAARRDDLSQNFALLDDFLAELQPTMVDLNGLAQQGTPLLADLRRAAPGLNTLSRNLPAFNAAATDSLVSLGKSAVVGQRALTKGRDEINQLGKAAKGSFSVADNLAKFLRDIDDPQRAVETDTRANVDTGRKGETGYTGMEGLLNYVYYQPGAINQYDEVGHLLHFSIFEVGTGPCANYNAGEYDPDGPARRPPRPAFPTSTARARRPTSPRPTAASPGSATTSPASRGGSLPPYSGKVCPGGSDDTLDLRPRQDVQRRGHLREPRQGGRRRRHQRQRRRRHRADRADPGLDRRGGVIGGSPGTPEPPVQGTGIPGLDNIGGLGGTLGLPDGAGSVGGQGRTQRRQRRPRRRSRRRPQPTTSSTTCSETDARDATHTRNRRPEARDEARQSPAGAGAVADDGRRDHDADRDRRRLPRLQREQRPALRARLPGLGRGAERLAPGPEQRGPDRRPPGRRRRVDRPRPAAARRPDRGHEDAAATPAESSPRLNLKLDKSAAPLPKNSIFRIRYRSSFGLKYLEITRGDGPPAPEGYTFNGTNDNDDPS